MARYKRAYPGPTQIHYGPAAAPAVTAAGLLQPAISPVIGYQHRARARLGPSSTVAAGVASPTATPPPVLSTRPGAQHCWIARAAPRSRARAGGIGAPAGSAGVKPFLTGVITTRDVGGTVTTWNITGTPAS